MKNNELLMAINASSPPDIQRARQFDAVRQLSAHEFGAFSLSAQQAREAAQTRETLRAFFENQAAVEQIPELAAV